MIELRGVGTHNKGAELMACAILEHYASFNGTLRFAVSPHFGTYQQRAKYGLATKLRTSRGRSCLLPILISRNFAETYGIVTDAQVIAVLDASGFAYGDPWGIDPARNLVREVRRFRRAGVPVVLLPQAFGPFEEPAIADAVADAAGYVDLIYARDDESLYHLKKLGIGPDKLRRAPDFTGLLDNNYDLAYSGEPCDGHALIIPNCRMLDMADHAHRADYIPFLANCIEGLERRGLGTCVLVHSRNDSQLADALESYLARHIPRVHEEDPVRLKARIGQASTVVGSRYHGLISALYQGIPAIGTSWSHKYEALFADFGCPNLLVSPAIEPDKLEPILDLVTDPVSYNALTATLDQAATRLRQETVQMWQEVDSRIGLATTQAAAKVSE